MSEEIRFGVLSTALIGVGKVTPAMQLGERTVVAAIASRERAKAEQCTSALGIEKAYGSYEEMLAAADIDAVNVPLQNHLHVPWSIRALEAGKHVLCEKPIGLTSIEAPELIDAGAEHPNLKLMEAFMYSHHPQA